MKSRKRQRGFSLVEVMVATVVVGLTLAAGIPAFARFTQTARLEGAARQMVGHFRLARQKAVAEGTPYIFLWWYSNWYYLIKDNDRDGFYTSGEPFTLYWLPSGIQTRGGDGFESPWMVLQPNGSCSESGTFTIENARGKTLNLTLVGPTGQVLVTREDGYDAGL